MLFAADEYYDSVGNHAHAFLTWWKRNGSRNVSPSMVLSRTV